MRDVLKTEELDIPEGVTIEVKSRIITVTGPRGTLTKNVRHVDMDIKLLKGKPNQVHFAVWQGGRKHVACLRTIRTLVNNMVIGVTKVKLNVICYQHSRKSQNCLIRASNTKCAPFMPISLSTSSYKIVVMLSKSETSWAKR